MSELPMKYPAYLSVTVRTVNGTSISHSDRLNISDKMPLRMKVNPAPLQAEHGKTPPNKKLSAYGGKPYWL